MVNIGDIVKPRQVIATVGRTGLNAFKKRSPTHLHFMVLKLDTNFYPTPINSYNLLLKSKF
jgi:murein DD-endopeptidase MepM/ murein hydrolase activator NlpD